jgi:hypothetical protein
LRQLLQIQNDPVPDEFSSKERQDWAVLFDRRVKRGRTRQFCFIATPLHAQRRRAKMKLEARILLTVRTLEPHFYCEDGDATHAFAHQAMWK